LKGKEKRRRKRVQSAKWKKKKGGGVTKEHTKASELPAQKQATTTN